MIACRRIALVAALALAALAPGGARSQIIEPSGEPGGLTIGQPFASPGGLASSPLVGHWRGEEGGSTVDVWFEPSGRLVVLHHDKQNQSVAPSDWLIARAALKGDKEHGQVALTEVKTPAGSKLKSMSYDIVSGGKTLWLGNNESGHDVIVLDRSPPSPAPTDQEVMSETGSSMGGDPTKDAIIQFGLPGWWAVNCDKPADEDNVHVLVVVPYSQRAVILVIPRETGAKPSFTLTVTRARISEDKLEFWGDVQPPQREEDLTGIVVHGALLREGNTMRVWSLHITGTAKRSFQHYHPGDKLDIDTVLHGRELDDGRPVEEVPVGQKCTPSDLTQILIGLGNRMSTISPTP